MTGCIFEGLRERTTRPRETPEITQEAVVTGGSSYAKVRLSECCRMTLEYCSKTDKDKEEALVHVVYA